MTDGLLKELAAAFKPELFVNHYGSSEIYTFTIDQNAPNKPGSAGRAGINQMVRVVRARRGVARRDRQARRGRRDHRAASGRRILRGLLAEARGRRQGAAPGLVLHRRHRLFRRRRRSVRHRPGRRHDHHRRRERLAGRDRKLPVAARGGVGGRGGRPARRALGQVVTAFIKRSARSRDGARRVLPHVGARQLQAAAPLCVRRGHPEIAGRQALAPPAGGGRIPAGKSAPRSQGTAA